MKALFLSVLSRTLWTWVRRLGGLALILTGVIDNSAIPLPGSTDIFLILLTAHNRAWWPYYALMATVVAVVGGYLTYRLAEKGGEQTLEKKIGKRRSKKVYEAFKKYGFLAIFVGVLLPPPFPAVPFLMVAGVLRYPRRSFLSAVALGRSVRFFILGYLSHIYGRVIASWLASEYKPILYVLLGLVLVGGGFCLLYIKWYVPKVSKTRGALV
jgi:membrane protein YqaA with SNARE-associated domain